MTKIEEGLKKHIYELEQELESTHKIVAKQSADITVYEEIVDDLESKLAKKEEQLRESREWFLECDKERLSEETKKNIAFTNYKETLKENEQLKQQLAEKEREIEKYKELCTISKLEDLQVENMLLKGKNQDKISFCIEQLEKVKNKFNGKRPIDDLANEVGLELGYTATQIQKYIDNQIEELKKEMK